MVLSADFLPPPAVGDMDFLLLGIVVAIVACNYLSPASFRHQTYFVFGFAVALSIGVFLDAPLSFVEQAKWWLLAIPVAPFLTKVSPLWLFAWANAYIAYPKWFL